MINAEEIIAPEFTTLIKTFDERIDYLNRQFNIELKTYGNILRIGLNTLQEESFINLLERINVNRELERALDNAGGYTVDFIGDNNPKSSLIDIITYLKDNSLKISMLLECLKTDNRRKIIIADINDIDFLKLQINNNRTNIISLAELKGYVKRGELQNERLVFYSFNGAKDFDFIYNVLFEVTIILYEQEHQLFYKQLQKRKQQIEEEVRSPDRLKLCGIKYEPIPDKPIYVSETIEDIVARLDSLSNSAYNCYKEESDSLLDEMEEKIIYRIALNNGSNIYLDSIQTVFTATGDLLKVYKTKNADRIRIYPRESLAENLYQVAVETEPEVFGKVEEHSKYWRSLITELSKKYDSTTLYQKLKSKGLRVLPNTVESYLRGFRKFPMYNSDLRAIIELHNTENNINEVEGLIVSILKSKTTYNSTMIALGRGLRQELSLFLKEKIIGEILEKRNFNAITLSKFIDEFMPLLTIINKEIYSNGLEQLELFDHLQHIEL